MIAQTKFERSGSGFCEGIQIISSECSLDSQSSAAANVFVNQAWRSHHQLYHNAEKASLGIWAEPISRILIRPLQLQ
jgi:hypothetical protein